MRVKEVRYYLHNFKTLLDDIERLQQDLEQYRLMDIDVFTVRHENDGSKHNKYSSNSIVENIAIPRLEYIARQENRIFYLRNIATAISNVTSKYDRESLERRILELRYFTKVRGRTRSWESIAQALNITEVYARKLDNKICRKILEEVKSYIRG